MPLETATYISSLNISNPTYNDNVDKADDHIRLIKSTLKNTFPNVSGAVLPTHTELNFVDGVTSAIQTQLDGKQPLDASLTALAALTTAANKGVYFSGADTPVTYDLTSYGRTLAGLADAAALKSNLGLGSAAYLTSGTSAGNVVTLDGSAKLPAVDGSQLTGLPSASGVESGAITAYVGLTAPSGWLLCSGKTIGDASSGGTARANADTATLFALLWDSFSNTVLPIQDSAGAASTRGANAAADYAAHKRLPLPDLQGRVIAGKDDMSGASANRLTGLSGGLNGDTMGATGGEEAHVLTTGELAAHTHTTYNTATPPGAGSALSSSNYAMGGALYGSGAAATIGKTSTSGSDTAHNNVQPTIILSYIVKL